MNRELRDRRTKLYKLREQRRHVDRIIIARWIRVGRLQQNVRLHIHRKRTAQNVQQHLIHLRFARPLQ